MPLSAQDNANGTIQDNMTLLLLTDALQDQEWLTLDNAISNTSMLFAIVTQNANGLSAQMDKVLLSLRKWMSVLMLQTSLMTNKSLMNARLSLISKAVSTPESASTTIALVSKTLQLLTFQQQSPAQELSNAINSMAQELQESVFR